MGNKILQFGCWGVFCLIAFSSATHAEELFFKPVVKDFDSSITGIERLVVTEEGGLAAFSESNLLIPGFPVTFSNEVVISDPLVSDFDDEIGAEILVITRNASNEYFIKMMDINGGIKSEKTLDVDSQSGEKPVNRALIYEEKYLIIPNNQGRLMEYTYKNNAWRFRYVGDNTAIVPDPDPTPDPNPTPEGDDDLEYDLYGTLGQYDQSGQSSAVSTLSNNNGVDGKNSLFFPSSGDLDNLNHRLFIADTENNRILVFNLDEQNNLLDRNADYVLGQKNFYTTTGDIGPDKMRLPMDVSYDDTKDLLYVADAGNTRVLVFDVNEIQDGEAAINVIGQLDFSQNNILASQSGFQSVENLKIDEINQKLFVSDTWGARVLVFDVNQISNGESALNVLGQTGFSSTGISTSASGFRRPKGLDIDSQKNLLYVADRTNSRVLVFDIAQIANGEAAVKVLGQAVFTSSGAATSNSRFNFTHDVALDSENQKLFVSDELNKRVLVFDVNEIVNGEASISVIGQPDFNTSEVSEVGASNFGIPQGLILNTNSGKLYAMDRLFNRIAIFDINQIDNGEQMIDVIGQSNSQGQAEFSTKGINNSGPVSKKGFSYNTGIAIDTSNHRLFVADSYHSRVLIFNLDQDNNLVDEEADYVLGQSDFSNSYYPDYLAPKASDIFQPSGLAFEADRNLLYVSDRSFNRILVFDMTTIENGEDAVNVLGQSSFDQITENLSKSGLYYPQGLSFDPVGKRLFVADEYNTRVLVFDLNEISNGENASFVLGQTDFTSANAGTGSSSMNYPLDTAYFEESNLLFVADSYSNRVLVFDASSLSNGSEAIKVLGQSDFASDIESSEVGGMNYPSGLGVDNARKLLYVTDSNNRIQVFDINTLTTGQAPRAKIEAPDFNLNLKDYLNFDGALYYEHIKPVAVDQNTGRIYVSESFSHKVSIFDPSTDTEQPPYAEEVITAIGQYNEDGTNSFTSNLANNNQQSGKNSLFLPNNGELDAEKHRLFVADTENNRVLVFNLDENNQLIDRDADYVIGQPDFRTTTARAGEDGLRLPMDVAFDSDKDILYVADSANARVLVFDVQQITNGESAINVLGQNEFSSTSVSASQNSFLSAEGLVFNKATQKLFVADTWGARVLVFDVNAISNGESAVNVLGQTNFTSTSIATTSSGFRRPKGMAIDAARNMLYVADRTNNRVLIFDIATIANGEAAIKVLGQTNFTGQAAATAAGRFNFVSDVVLDTTRNLAFISDELNKRVLVFDVTDIVNGENAVNVFGYSDFTSSTESVPGANNLGAASGLIYSSSTQMLYAVDRTFNRIGIFDTSTITNGENMVDLLGQSDEFGTPVFTSRNVNNTQKPDTGFVYNTGVTMDRIHHRLFVADSYSSRVLVFNLNENNELIDKNADYVFGQNSVHETLLPDYLNPTARDIFQPSGLAFDDTKNLLYVADRSFNRILVFDTTTINNGENAVKVLGQSGFNSVSESLTASGLSYPQGISLDTNGQRLFVSDEYNTRVLVFDVNEVTNGENAVNVLGQTSFAEANADITQSTFNYPLAVAYYARNDWLFVADSYSNRILVFDAANLNDGAQAIHVLGQSDFTSSDAGAGAAGMYYPAGLGVDNTRNLLYVSDGNSRVLVFDLETISNGAESIGVIGQPDFDSVGASFPTINNVNLSDYLNFDGAIYYEHLKPIFVNEDNGRIYVSEPFNHRISVFDIAVSDGGGDDGSGDDGGGGTTEDYDNGLPDGEIFATAATTANDKLYNTRFDEKVDAWTMTDDRWSNSVVAINQKIIYEPAVSSSGIVYGINDSNQLYAWNSQSGQSIANFPVNIDDATISGPAMINIGGAERVLIVTVDGLKHIYNSDGTLFWTTTKESPENVTLLTQDTDDGSLEGSFSISGWESLADDNYFIKSIFSRL